QSEDSQNKQSDDSFSSTTRYRDSWRTVSGRQLADVTWRWIHADKLARLAVWSFLFRDASDAVAIVFHLAPLFQIELHLGDRLARLAVWSIVFHDARGAIAIVFHNGPLFQLERHLG